MGKSRTDRHGHTREQKLWYENQQLKKKVSSLRKQLARIDLDRYDTIKEMIQEHYVEEKADQGKAILENLKKTWACKSCEDGFLEIFVYNRGGSTWYYRICSNAPLCMNRTKSQEWNNSVKGIARKDKGSQV